METPFFTRLREYFTQVGKVLRGEAGAASIFPNPTDVGNSRERIYGEILKLHLPSMCNIAFGGFLFDQIGNESKQIDIIITNSAALQFNFFSKDGGGRSFACIDGAIGVVCVKSTLDTAKLVDSLQNIASIPDKLPLTPERYPSTLQFKGYEDWPFKVIYASDGASLQTILESLVQFFTENSDIPWHKRPNLIYVAGKYVIIKLGEEGGKTRDGKELSPYRFYGFPESTDVYGLLDAITQIQRIALISKHIIYTYIGLLDKIPL
jgi:roadblock/LC7 domain-containing protein